jgi:hypothetical protein
MEIANLIRMTKILKPLTLIKSGWRFSCDGVSCQLGTLCIFNTSDTRTEGGNNK